MTTMVPTIPLPPRLGALFRDCARYCVPGCCGIEAYWFSPLFVATHLSSWSGQIRKEHVNALRTEIRALVAEALACTPTGPSGVVCLIESTEQPVTKDQLQELQVAIEAGLRWAPVVLWWANRFDRTWKRRKARRKMS